MESSNQDKSAYLSAGRLNRAKRDEAGNASERKKQSSAIELTTASSCSAKSVRLAVVGGCKDSDMVLGRVEGRFEMAEMVARKLLSRRERERTETSISR